MGMKCPTCGKENPEGQKFCGDCGSIIPVPPPAEPMQPTPIPTKQSWLSSSWKVLVAVIVVVVVMFASIGLIYSQPWSKIKILAENVSGQSASYSFLIDGVEKARGTILPGGNVIIGVWSVKTGSHTVSADCHYLGALGPSLDDEMEYTYEYAVGPLYTKNAYITLDPETPDLVGDLTMYYDDWNDEVSIEGKVFNYANAPCYGVLTFTAQDSRGWHVTDTTPLGRIGANGAYVEVSKTIDWPDYYLGEYNDYTIPSWDYTLTFL